jgi:hypothetical protein
MKIEKVKTIEVFDLSNRQFIFNDLYGRDISVDCQFGDDNKLTIKLKRDDSRLEENKKIQ